LEEIKEDLSDCSVDSDDLEGDIDLSDSSDEDSDPENGKKERMRLKEEAAK